MKRMIAFLMLCAMLITSLGLLSACGDDSGNGNGGGTEVTKDFIDNLGERNYKGEDFTVSVLDTYKNEVYSEESAEVLDNAVYLRNRAIEARFNVNIVPDITLPDNQHLAHIGYLQRVFNSGDATVDVGMLYVYKAGILVVDEKLTEQREYIPYVKDALNNGSDWWSTDINNAFTVRGKQYVSVSDWCVTAMSMTYTMVFNKEYETDNNVASSLGYSSMYDIVRQGNWTMDLFRSIVKDRYEDLNNDTLINAADDFVGFVCDHSTALDQFAPAFNLNYITNDGISSPELFNMDSHAVSAFESLYSLFFGAGKGASFNHASDTVVNSFSQERSFIAALPLERYSEETFRNLEFEYGILPYPKLDSNQRNYYSGTVDNYSVICVLAMHDETRLEFIGTMIEALSAETHQSVLPDYYNLIVTHKNTTDEESIEMIEIIMAGRLYDFATLHYDRLSYTHTANGGYNFGLGLLIRHSITYKFGADITSHWEGVKDVVARNLEELIDEYTNMY